MPLLRQSFSPITVQQIRLAASDKVFVNGSTKTQCALIQHIADCLGVNDMEIAVVMNADVEAIDRYGRPLA